MVVGKTCFGSRHEGRRNGRQDYRVNGWYKGYKSIHKRDKRQFILDEFSRSILHEFFTCNSVDHPSLPPLCNENLIETHMKIKQQN